MQTDVVTLLDTGECDPLGNRIVLGCPFPSWCKFTPGPLHRHSIIPDPPVPAADVAELRRLESLVLAWRARIVGVDADVFPHYAALIAWADARR